MQRGFFSSAPGKRAPVVAGLILLLLVTVAAGAWAAQQKGIQRVIKTESGRQVGLYTGSHALLIGVGAYQHWPRLESVSGEMDELAQALDEQKFEVVRVKDPDASALRAAFENFINRYGFDPDNQLLFFFSGHGHTRMEGKRGYLVPVDAPDPRKDERGFLQKAITMNQVMAWARRIEAKHALFIFDSCFSGTVFESKSLPDHPPHISDYTSRPVRQFITAGSAKEEVPAKSVFTPSFIRALRGEGDLNKDGYVTGTELGMYLHDKVIYYRTGQTPQYGKIRDPDLDEGDFVFFLADSGGSQVVVPPPPVKPPEKPKPGSLTVKSSVAGAAVTVNGKAFGDAPKVFSIDRQGSYRVEVTKAGYDPYAVTVEMGPGETRVLTAHLEKISAPVAPVSSEPRPGEIWKEPKTGMEFVWVPKGCFQMGSNEGSSDEKPVHEVCVDGFWMGKNEVTVGQWKRFISDSRYKGDSDKSYGCKGMGDPEFSQDDSHPAACISWKEAVAFSKWLSDRSNYEFRLPSEAEWEYACRSGGKDEKFSGTSNEAQLSRYANFCDKNCGFDWKTQNQDDGYTYTSPAGAYMQNGLGIYDMSGNVWEWCLDRYASDAYSKHDRNNPIYAGGVSDIYAGGAVRVLRGGCWGDEPAFVRCADRYCYSPGGRYNDLGFRLLRTP